MALLRWRLTVSMILAKWPFCTSESAAKSVVEIVQKPRESLVTLMLISRLSAYSGNRALAMLSSAESEYFRMVAGYWDMAASFVVHDAIDPEMFRSVSGEMLATYSKVEHLIHEIRESAGQPGLFANVEQVAADWPGAKESMAGIREYFMNLAANE